MSKNSVQIVEVRPKVSKSTGKGFDIVIFSDETEVFYFRDLKDVEAGVLGIPEIVSGKIGDKLVGWTVTGRAEPPKPPDWDAKDRGKTMGGVTHGAVGEIISAMIQAGTLKKYDDIVTHFQSLSIEAYGLSMQASENAIAYPGFNPLKDS